MAKLSDPVTILKGVGPTKAKQFANLNIYTLGDLICHFPRGYEDRTKLVPIAKLEPDVPACFKACVMTTPRTSHIRKGLDITKVQVADTTGRLNLTFFNQKFTTGQLQYGKEYIFYGAVSGDFIGYVIYHAYDADSVEIGWVLLPEYWGRGYASALTERLIGRARQEQKSVVIECAPAQAATKRIAVKKGFRACGNCDGLAVYRLP